MLFLALGPAALVALMQTQRDDLAHPDLSWLLFGPDQLEVVRQTPSPQLAAMHPGLAPRSPSFPDMGEGGSQKR